MTNKLFNELDFSSIYKDKIRKFDENESEVFIFKFLKKILLNSDIHHNI